MKRTPLRAKKPWKRKQKKEKPKKENKLGLWAVYGLTQPSYVRYSGRKGVYWHLFSMKVRKRDFAQYGSCIDCGTRVSHWREFQAGHFIPAAKGFMFLFDERNVNAQLPACNSPKISPLSSIGYARGLDARYGMGTADYFLLRQYEKCKEWTQIEYDKNIRKLLEEGVHLENYQ